jgi:hypothetical protein
MSNILDIYERLKQQTFPSVGKRVGDFPLYDALLAGIADRAVRGERIMPQDLPVLDDECASYINNLRSNDNRSNEDQEFIDYYNILEELCNALKYQ